MALAEQVIDIPLGGGLAQREADHLIMSPRNLIVQNFDFNEAGGYRVRDGYSAIDLTGLTEDVPTPNSIFSYKGTLHCNTKKTGIFARSSNAARWIRRNESAQHPTELNVKELIRFPEGVSEVDSCVHNGYLVVAWNLGRTHADTLVHGYVMVLDATTLAVVVPATKLTDLGFGVRVAPFTKSGVKYVAIIGVEDDVFPAVGVAMNGVIVDVSSSPPSIGSVTQITTGVSVTTPTTDPTNPLKPRSASFDAHGDVNEVFFNIVYWDGTDTKVIKVDNALTVLATRTVATNMARCQAIFHSTIQGTIYVVGADGTNVKSFTVDEAYSVTGGVNTLFADTADEAAVSPRSKATICDNLQSGNMWVAWSAANVDFLIADAAPALQTHEVVFSDMNPSTAAQVGTVGRTFGALLAGKAFCPNEHFPHVPLRIAAYIAAAALGPTGGHKKNSCPHSSFLVGALYDPTRILSPTTQGGDHVILNNDPKLKVVARYFQDRYFLQEEPHNSGTHLPGTMLLTGSKFIWASQCSIAAGLAGLYDNPYEELDYNKGADVVVLDVDPPPIKYVQHGELVTTSGGLTGSYDGLMLSEMLPLSAPGYPQFSTSGGGPGAPANTTFKAFWFWRDAQGKLHRGPTSHLIDDLQATVSTVTMRFQYPPTNLNGENNISLSLALYRKQPTDALHTLIGIYPPSTAADPTNRGYIIAFSANQGLHQPGPALYTENGEVDNICPPSSLDLVVGNGKIYLLSGEDPTQIWSSGGSQAFFAPHMSSEFVDVVAESEDDLNSLSILDSKCVAFSKNGVFYLSGDGFTTTGLGGHGLSRISSDVGCINRNSVAYGSFGVVFESDRGIYLLDRGLSLSYIGEAVQDSVKEATILRAVVLDDRNQVRFVMSDRILVWDYLQNAWATFLVGSTAGGGTKNPVDGLRHSSDFYLLRASASVTEILKEDPAATTDNGARIVPKLKTPWIKLTGMQGYARLWRVMVLGYNDTNGGNFTIKAWNNYQPAENQVAWSKSKRKVDRSSGDRLQLKFHVPKQKVESVMFEISGETIDGGAFDNAAEYTLTSITLVAGVKKGEYKDITTIDKA